MNNKIFFIFILFFILNFFILANAITIEEIKNKPKLLKDPIILGEALRLDTPTVFEILNQNSHIIDEMNNETKKILFDKFEEELLNASLSDNLWKIELYPRLITKWLYYYGIVDETKDKIHISGFSIIEGKYKELSIMVREKYLIFILNLVKGKIYDDYFMTDKGTKIFYGEFYKKNDTLYLLFGKADITNSKEKINFYRSSIKFKDINLLNNEEETRGNALVEIFEEKKEKNKIYLSVEAEEKLEIDTNDKIKYISGKALIDLDTKDIILDKNSYIEFGNFLINVKNKTVISESCLGKENCISANIGIIVINDIKNNEIRILKKSIYPEVFSIFLISGKIEFIEGNSILIFSKDGIKIKGDLNDFISTITFYSESLPYYIRLENGSFYYCYKENNEKCKNMGNIKPVKIRLSKEGKILEKIFGFAYNAANDESYASIGGAKCTMVYPDLYSDVKKPTTLEQWKKTKIEELSKVMKRIEEEIDTATPDEKIYLIEELDRVKERIEKIKKIKKAYDCIGLVQQSLNKAIPEVNWFKVYSTKKIIEKLSRFGKFKPVLLVWGKPIDDKTYRHGDGTIAILPEVPKGTEILYFDTKYERDFFLAKAPKGAPFQNYMKDGRPIHSGIKGKGTTSIEAHIGTNEISVDSITRYNDPILIVLIEKPELSLERILALVKK